MEERRSYSRSVSYTHLDVYKRQPKIRAEVDYLEPGYTFMLSVNGTDLACACRRTASGSFKRVPPAAIASDVEPGSGLASADAQAFTVDYVIAFRSLAYAFACFTGGVTLKAALAQRADVYKRQPWERAAPNTLPARANACMAASGSGSSANTPAW